LNMSTGAYNYVSTSTLRAAGPDEGGTLYQEMLKRQELLRNFETDVYNRDDTDTCEKTGEALLHVTGKSETCTPLIAGRACMGMTTAMNEIRKAREQSHLDFENKNECERDTAYGNSEFANELDDHSFGDPLNISARHRPHGNASPPRAVGEQFTSSPTKEGVKDCSSMSPSRQPFEDAALGALFGGANKLEFSNKRVSGFDPNTFHLESIVLNKDGSFEHRDTAEWYKWKDGDDSHDGWVYIQKGVFCVSKNRHEFSVRLHATRLYNQETFEDASREYAVYVSADGQLLTLESALMAGRRGGAADSTVALTLGGAVQTMGGHMWKPITSEFVYDYKYERQGNLMMNV